MLVQLRDELVAEAEGFNVPEGNTRRPIGEGMEVRRSPQAVACRKRYVEELGRSHRFLPVGRMVVRSQLLRHARGNPETGLGWNLSEHGERRTRQAEEYCERESPPYADGESYQE